MSDEFTICEVGTCDRPSDGWIVCRTCGDQFVKTLGEIPWLIDELGLVQSLQVSYTSEKTRSSTTSPLPVNLKAGEVLAMLQNALSTGARAVAESNQWNVEGAPDRWLMKRISAVRLHPAGAQIIEEINTAYAGGLWVIDRPENRQYLGDCAATGGSPECIGRIYGRPSKHEARCDCCGLTWDADRLRSALLRQLDERLLTAAEIARLSTYLGMTIDRERVRKRINQWRVRGQIEVRQYQKRDSDDEVGDAVEGEPGSPMFRFKDALVLLERDEQTRRSA